MAAGMLAVWEIVERHYVALAVAVVAVAIIVGLVVVLSRVWPGHVQRPPQISSSAPETVRAVLAEWGKLEAAGPSSSGSSRAVAADLARRSGPVETRDIDRLLKLAELLEKDLVTRQEFDLEKRLLLERDACRAVGYVAPPPPSVNGASRPEGDAKPE